MPGALIGAGSGEKHDGSSQRWSPVATSRRSWRFSKRLTAAQLGVLKTFYYAHVNLPFLYEDLLSGTTIKAVFASAWNETVGFPRHTVDLELEEVY